MISSARRIGGKTDDWPANLAVDQIDIVPSINRKPAEGEGALLTRYTVPSFPARII